MPSTDSFNDQYIIIFYRLVSVQFDEKSDVIETPASEDSEDEDEEDKEDVANDDTDE